MGQFCYIQLWIRKLKHRAIKSLDLGCTVFDPQSWDSVSSCLLPLFDFLSKMLYHPSLWGKVSNITKAWSFSSWTQTINKHGKTWAISHRWLTCFETPCGVQFMEMLVSSLALIVSFSCCPQSVSTCSPASGTTVLITACMEAIAERPSGKVYLSCMGIEVSTMTRSSQLSKHSMRRSEM